MRKYKPVEFYFDLEIKRTVRRLRKEHQNLKVVNIDDLQDMGNLNPHGVVEPLNAQGGQ